MIEFADGLHRAECFCAHARGIRDTLAGTHGLNRVWIKADRAASGCLLVNPGVTAAADRAEGLERSANKAEN